MNYDEIVLQKFLDAQEQLFPTRVVESLEEADDFLTDCFAVVVASIEEVKKYFEDEGVDVSGMRMDELRDAEEVFEIGDGRFLIVEA